MSHLTLTPIGTIKIEEEGMFIQLEPQYSPALEALDGFSHINTLWWFHEFDHSASRAVLTTPKPYKTAPNTMGIFATRSPVRPNPIALTTSQIIRIDAKKGRIQIAYTDANDNSPVLDIKPYTPSLDRVASPGTPKWCEHWPKSLEESASFDWQNEYNF